MYGRVVLLDGSYKDIVLPDGKTSESDQEELRSQLMKHGGTHQIIGSAEEHADFSPDEVINVTFHEDTK